MLRCLFSYLIIVLRFCFFLLFFIFMFFVFICNFVFVMLAIHLIIRFCHPFFLPLVFLATKIVMLSYYNFIILVFVWFFFFFCGIELCPLLCSGVYSLLSADPVRHRTSGQGVPERDHAEKLHLPL